MDSGNITANVVEGKVNRVSVVYVDDNGQPKKTGGETPVEVVERELPFEASSLDWLNAISSDFASAACDCRSCSDLGSA